MSKSEIPVLVTGGAGYVGSHCCKVLAGSGFLPITYDNLSRGHRWAVKWGPFEAGDIHDRARLNYVLARYRPQAVVHFAALAHVGESVTDPAAYYYNNIAGTLTLLEAVRAAGLERLVFSSTCAVYGLPQQIPMPESHPKMPIHPYGRTKLVVEQILEDYARAYGLRTVSLRYFNAAGADMAGEIGEDHQPETHLIPRAIRAALGQLPALKVYGTDYDTVDGTAVRDYIHVMDLAEAHVAAIRYLVAGGETRAFNLGTGRGTSVYEIIRAVERALGRLVPTSTEARRPGDPPELVADAGPAQEVLGWRPAMPGVEEIVASACRWHTINDDAWPTPRSA